MTSCDPEVTQQRTHTERRSLCWKSIKYSQSITGLEGGGVLTESSLPLRDESAGLGPGQPDWDQASRTGTRSSVGRVNSCRLYTLQNESGLVSLPSSLI